MSMPNRMDLSAHPSFVEKEDLSGGEAFESRFRGCAFLRCRPMVSFLKAYPQAGISIKWGWFDSPFGRAIIAGLLDKEDSFHGVCALGLASEIGQSLALEDIRRRWPRARFSEDAPFLRVYASCIFDTAGDKDIDTPLILGGTDFQLKVWRALLEVPFGGLTTYAEIAAAAGYPKAVRAVGSAVGRNPISLLIPCHRVMRKGGGLGGYHWGLPIKQKILSWEVSHSGIGENRV